MSPRSAIYMLVSLANYWAPLPRDDTRASVFAAQEFTMVAMGFLMAAEFVRAYAMEGGACG